MMTTTSRCFAAVTAIALLLPTSVPAQVHHDIVRGRVLSDSGAAVRAADVIVTRTSDRVAKATTSGADGTYSVDWPDGTGDYALTVSATGFKAVSIHVVRADGDSVLVADVRLSAIAQRLAPVVTQARRPVPDRDPANYGAGGTEASTYAQNAARRLAPDQAGDLNAIAAMLPGVTPVAGGGISVLGLGPGQNSVTMNGLAFSGADIPRDALTRVRVLASTYDPANGWFSGAQTAVDLVLGGQFTSRTSHLTLDAPALQYSDHVSSRAGQQYTNLNASLGGSGPLADGKWAYNYGAQGGRKSSDVASLVTADADLLQHAGVSPDSVARFLALLGQAQIPTSVGGLPSATIDDNVSFIGRIDHAPYDWTMVAYNPTTYGLQGYGKWSRTEAAGLSAIGTPAHSGTNAQMLGSLTAFYTTLFGPSYLADVKSGVTFTHNTSDPYLSLPDGRALVVSSFPGGGGGVSTLQFGGNGNMQTDTRAWRWETNAQMQFYPPGALTHRLKLAADARFDDFSQDLFGNRLGTFSYNSLTDLAANRPSSFTRTLTAPTRRGGEWNGFASLGDLWRVNEKLQVIYGARVDGNVFTQTPELNPLVSSAFGLHTDRGPN
ncbi:MAG: carboxypeptidase-like regulatory domain-containing protein, partial [Gemmatimonas sp.]|nr:carboxypeptidase-like regulatory domain-containing protein [Gemmatimonadaceae bacterium]